jgi:hypothetical protein
MSPWPHEAAQLPHDREHIIGHDWRPSPDISATLQTVTGYSVDDLYHFGGYDPVIVRDFPETIIHDARDELPCVLDNEEVLVMPEIVVEAAKIIAREPMILVDYPLPELFTRVRQIVERRACLELALAEHFRRATRATPGPRRPATTGSAIDAPPTHAQQESPTLSWDQLLGSFLEEQPQWLLPEFGDRPLLLGAEPSALFSAAAMTAFAHWIAQRGYTACGQCQAPMQQLGIEWQALCQRCEQQMMSEVYAEMARDSE